MKLEPVLSPVQAKDLFHSSQHWMSFVCDLHLGTSDSAMSEAHATHLQESICETHGPYNDYLIEVESNL